MDFGPEQALIKRAMRGVASAQKRLERAEARLEWSEKTRLEQEERLEWSEKTRLEQEERLEQAEENLANVLSYKLNMSVSEVSDDDESVSEVSDDDEPQLVWWCGTCEEKLKKKDDEIMDLKERLKCAEERLERAEKSRDHALELVEGPVIHSLKVILDNTQEHLTSQRLSEHRRVGEDILCSAGWKMRRPLVLTGKKYNQCSKITVKISLRIFYSHH